LDLSNNKLDEIDVAIFSPCTALQELYLDGNRLTQLDLENIPNLKFIGLLNNNFERPVLEEIFEVIKRRNTSFADPLGNGSFEQMYDKEDPDLSIANIESKSDDKYVQLQDEVRQLRNQLAMAVNQSIEQTANFNNSIAKMTNLITEKSNTYLMTGISVFLLIIVTILVSYLLALKHCKSMIIQKKVTTRPISQDLRWDDFLLNATQLASPVVS
jgi:Leucine-rich repeat (LRR) protein